MLDAVQRLPTSTLFPYTTLFRSLHLHRGLERRGAGRIEVREPGIERAPHATAEESSHVDAALPVRRQDRKSTRLNSSHSQISYAVFCLKKKKTRRRPVLPDRTHQ